MKLLTLNLVTCARKACKTSSASFPLHPREVELEIVEAELNPLFLSNMMRKLEWEAVLIVAQELNMHTLIPQTRPEITDLVSNVTNDAGHIVGQEPTQLAKVLHRVLIETRITEGKLLCANCRHEYAVKEGIANFLLPAHLV